MSVPFLSFFFFLFCRFVFQLSFPFFAALRKKKAFFFFFGRKLVLPIPPCGPQTLPSEVFPRCLLFWAEVPPFFKRRVGYTSLFRVWFRG